MACRSRGRATLPELARTPESPKVQPAKLQPAQPEPPFCITPITELEATAPLDWLWYGYLLPGHMTLLTAIWKSGKTTLLSYLLRECESGGDLAGEVKPARVLVVSEETQELWRRRRNRIQLGGHIHLCCQPFLGMPTGPDWYKLIAFVAEAAAAAPYQLVVLDTITSLWSCRDENDASRMLEALAPLRLVTKTGAALLIIHHPNKSDASEGRASRGSGVLPGFADCIIEVRRYRPGDRRDCRRVLTAYSRFEETPSQVVIELMDTGFVTLGAKSTAQRQDRCKVLTGLLPSSPPGLTVSEILESWEGEAIAKPGLRTVQKDLNQAVEDGWAMSGGDGKKSDPYRYWLANG